MTPPASYSLVWSDEFPGVSIDATKWSVSNSGNGGSSGTFKNTQGTVANGILSCAVDAGLDAFFMKSLYWFKYCYLEVLAQFPSGNCSGLWMTPAFLWSDDFTNSPNNNYYQEIDVAEAHKAIATNYYNIIYQTAPTKSQNPQAVGPDPFVDGLWHKYATLWTPSQITFYCDDVVMGTPQANPFGHTPNRNMQIAVEATIGGFGGTPDGSTTFPAVLNIDYIRVYQQARAPLAVLK